VPELNTSIVPRVSAWAALAASPLPEWPAWVGGGLRRRQDPLSRVALATSIAAGVAPVGSPGALPEDSAVAVATSYGSVVSTLRFADSMRAFGDGGASPTPFTTSVHHAAAGALGEMLGLHGPTTTISQGGTGALSALRWAFLVVAAGRAPVALVVAADVHTDWSRGMVERLSGARWPIGDGAAALVLRAAGPGRELRVGRHAATVVVDGGALRADDENALATAAQGQRRVVAPDHLGRWWPCCTVAALPWTTAGAMQLRECERGTVVEMWLGS
jgi:hypothetical protein